MSNLGAVHGGAFFSAVGVTFDNLDRLREVVSADVLDAWFDPAPAVVDRLRQYLPYLARTSAPLHAEGLVEVIAQSRGVPPECVLTGAGSSALMFSCLPHLVDAGQTVLRLDPMYGEYDHICQSLLSAQVIQHQLDPRRMFDIDDELLGQICQDLEPHAVLLVNPNNPTGRLWPRGRLLAWLDQLPRQTIVLVDETYLEFADESASLESAVVDRPNLLVLKSMSKVYALSGLRIGYLVAHPFLVERLARFIPPWPVNLLGQVAAVEALRQVDYYRARWQETAELRAALSSRLRALGIKVYDTQTNWLLLELGEPARLRTALREHNIFVRDCASMGPVLADRFLRIAVKDPAQNERIVAAVEAAL